MSTPTFLANKNTHERDSHILFEEGPHIYTIDGNSNFMSVTKWNHSHFPYFNAPKIIRRMMSSKKWPESQYFGMTSKEIQTKWRTNGREAATAGTKMHYDIECFYNNESVDNNSTEFTYFESFHEQIGSKLIPYRTEWMIYDKKLKMAGSIDMIYQDPEDGALIIYDWKRCKEIKKINNFESAKTECISHLPNSNFWHYSLQLNTYKAIIEKNYGKKVKGMFLVCLHPNNKNESWLRFEVPDLQEDINSLFSLRLKKLYGKEYKQYL